MKLRVEMVTVYLGATAEMDQARGADPSPTRLNDNTARNERGCRPISNQVQGIAGHCHAPLVRRTVELVRIRVDGPFR